MNSYTVWFLYEFIQTNSNNCYTNCTVQICTQCGFCTNSYNVYTNCIVRIHTRCDFFIFFLSLHKPQVCSAVSAQRELRGAKPEHTSCPDALIVILLLINIIFSSFNNVYPSQILLVDCCVLCCWGCGPIAAV
jgi:hypothetical protein